MNKSKRGPYRMITTENETNTRARKYRLHPAPVGFNARRPPVLKTSAMYGAPKIGIKFKIGAAPILAHRPKDLLQMFLRFGVRAVERIPGTAPPTAKSDLV